MPVGSSPVIPKEDDLMKRHSWLWLTALSGPLFLASCGGTPTDPPKVRVPDTGAEAGGGEAAIRANLAKLSPEDRKLAEEQKFCAVHTDNRLGSMGVPVKVMVKDQPVFLCCGNCKPTALADTDKTLARVQQLKGEAAPASQAERVPEVTVLRVPDKGIQPQVAVDGKGTVHLIYYSGDPAHGDIFYVRSEAGGDKFSRPLRVNSVAGSAIAIGNIRGAHLALGKNGRVHVAWNGSEKAEPKAPGNAAPMLYTRLNDEGTAFEPQRNVIQAAVVLDGGGSLAADGAGNVYVTWHAPAPGEKGEGKRCVWVARSSDDGKTFAAEKRANADPTGACGCCGLRAFADSKEAVYVLYRTAREDVHRDMYLLASSDKGEHFRGDKVQEWQVTTCPMSSEAFAEGAGGVLAAWETDGQVYYCRIDPATGKRSPPVAAPGRAKGRKHPALAVNARGETLLVWTEGMGWDRGGAVAWQVFDKDDKPTGASGRADGVPTWSLVAAFARPDGSFTILY
jgi:hypothetical protein